MGCCFGVWLEGGVQRGGRHKSVRFVHPIEELFNDMHKVIMHRHADT